MSSTNSVDYPEEEGIYSSDGDSQCGDTSQNLGQDQFSQPYAVGHSGMLQLQPSYSRLQKPQPTPRKNRNRGVVLDPSATGILNGHHSSTTAQNPGQGPTENGHSPQAKDIFHLEAQIKALSTSNSKKSVSKKQFYIGIGLFVIPIFLCQLWVIQQMHDSYHHRIDALEAEHRDSTIKLILEISELKTNVQKELKSMETKMSTQFSALRTEIKMLKSNSMVGQNYDGQDDLTATEELNAQIQKQVSPSDKVSNFRDLIISLKSEVKSQFRETWIELYSGIVHTMEHESARPASIVLLVPPSIENFGDCFARELAKIVNSAHGRDGAATKEIYSDYWDRFSTLTELNRDLETYLANNGKSVIVYEPDKIRREDFLMTLHSFCDNFMAFDKSATFIFVIHVPDHVVHEHGWSETSGPDISRSILHGGWENVMSLDKRAALIARIAVNVVSLKEGDSCT